MGARALHTHEATAELERIYRAHADFVWRSVQRFGVTAAHAEDVVHEVFLVVQRRLPDLDPTASVRGWLWGIARGVAANHRRGRARAARREQVSLEVVPPPTPTDPEQQVHIAEAAAVVRRFLAQLPPDKRVVFELADIEGLSCPEIAELLELELGKVYAQLRTARRRFRAFIERETEPHVELHSLHPREST
ncbi:MAG: sigma-70 family RNA polymerase sigma factor [Enhygromyxa sp.]